MFSATYLCKLSLNGEMIDEHCLCKFYDIHRRTPFSTILSASGEITTLESLPVTLLNFRSLPFLLIFDPAAITSSSGRIDEMPIILEEVLDWSSKRHATFKAGRIAG